MKSYRKKQDIEPDRPTRFLFDGITPKFWPPRPNRFWSTLLNPFRRWYTRTQWHVSEVIIEDIKEIYKKFDPNSEIAWQLSGIRPMDKTAIGKWRQNKERIRDQLDRYPELQQYLIKYGYEKDNMWQQEIETE